MQTRITQKSKIRGAMTWWLVHASVTRLGVQSFEFATVVGGLIETMQNERWDRHKMKSAAN